jgi:hypothetical protein
MYLLAPRDHSRKQKAHADEKKVLRITEQALWVLTFHHLILKTQDGTHVVSACYAVVYSVCILTLNMCAYKRKRRK